ncbi:YpfN family protein [Enterobacteriaceae bacterium LUAb1]
MAWLKEHWWLLIIILLVGVMLNVIKELRRIDPKKYLDNKPDLPPHRDFNKQWDDDDDWTKKK